MSATGATTSTAAAGVPLARDPIPDAPHFSTPLGARAGRYFNECANNINLNQGHLYIFLHKMYPLQTKISLRAQIGLLDTKQILHDLSCSEETTQPFFPSINEKLLEEKDRIAKLFVKCSYSIEHVFPNTYEGFSSKYEMSATFVDSPAPATTAAAPSNPNPSAQK